MFVACGIWCLADVSSVSPSSEQTVCVTVCNCMYKHVQACSTLYGSFRAKYLCNDVQPCPTVCDRM